MSLLLCSLSYPDGVNLYAVSEHDPGEKLLEHC